VVRRLVIWGGGAALACAVGVAMFVATDNGFAGSLDVGGQEGRLILFAVATFAGLSPGLLVASVGSLTFRRVLVALTVAVTCAAATNVVTCGWMIRGDFDLYYLQEAESWSAGDRPVYWLGEVYAGRRAVPLNGLGAPTFHYEGLGSALTVFPSAPDDLVPTWRGHAWGSECAGSPVAVDSAGVVVHVSAVSAPDCPALIAALRPLRRPSLIPL
jgi:hypothetical protein